jgi:UDP-glucose 4-epimerase
MTHGVIYDFINKMHKNPCELLIRGDGQQEKNYFLVEECIEGMAYAFRNIPMTEDQPCDIFNLGTTSVSRVTAIAEIIREEINLPEASILIEGTKKAWPGDQPRVHFTVDKINKLGWKARYSSDEAVRIAVRRMLGKTDGTK